MTVRETPVQKVASVTAGGFVIHGENFVIDTDDRIELSGGLSLRRIQLFGASPVVRLTRVINNSTAILYDTSRTRVEFALARPF